MDFLRQSDEILSVGEFSRRLKMLVKTQIPELWLKGEVSNVKTYSSGHTYFTLKDDEGAVSAVLFKGYSRSVSLRLADGMRVFAFGEISIYEARGSYQLVVKALIPDGTGDLAARFQALKEKLSAEGLFDKSRKKPIPTLPRKIAVITSPTGAAIRDFCRILVRRNWRGEVVVIPSRVQGVEAAGELADAIGTAGKFRFADGSGFDLVVVMRGGGSLEDLWPFNEEVLARAVADCPLPTISAVGHEIDFTLSDFAADVRAETPSAAAELVSSSRLESESRLGLAASGIQKAVSSRIENLFMRLDSLSDVLRLNSPESKIAALRTKLDAAAARLCAASSAVLAKKRTELVAANGKYARLTPRRRIEMYSQKLESLEKHLEILSVEGVLKRGFSLALDSDGNFIQRAENVPDAPFNLRFSDGTLRVEKSR